MYYSTLYSTIVTLNTVIVTYVFTLVYNTLYSPGPFPDDSTGSCLLLWASSGHLLKFIGGVDGLKASMYVFQSLSADIILEFFCSHCIQCDTLIHYLLNELHAYKTDYGSDALAPISRGADASLAGEHALASPTSTEELRSVAADVNGLRSDIGSVNDMLRSLMSVVVQAACTAAMALQHLDSSQHLATISDSEPCASRTPTPPHAALHNTVRPHATDTCPPSPGGQNSALPHIMTLPYAIHACHFSDLTSTPYPWPHDSMGASCSFKRYNRPKEQVLEGHH
jgi:hypothetical protein